MPSTPVQGAGFACGTSVGLLDRLLDVPGASIVCFTLIWGLTIGLLHLLQWQPACLLEIRGDEYKWFFTVRPSSVTPRAFQPLRDTGCAG